MGERMARESLLIEVCFNSPLLMSSVIPFSSHKDALTTSLKNIFAHPSVHTRYSQCRIEEIASDEFSFL